MNKHNLRISSITDNSKKIQDYIDKDGYPGKFLGFESLHPYYTHKDAGCTDWTGEPSSGKTYFVLEMLFQLSERYGQINAIYVPDLGSYVDIVGKLLKMHTGVWINPKYGKKATMKDVFDSIPFLAKHFLILEKQNIRETVTPEKIWEFCADWKGYNGERINNVLIDSWKNLYHDTMGKREDQYLDYVLSYRNELAENSNMHFHTIAHAVKTELEEERDETGKRKRRIITAYDIKGGGSWYANGKNIITVDRPDKKNRIANIYIWKTKPEDVGKQGSVIDVIELDWERGRYYERLEKEHGVEVNRPWEFVKFSKIANPDMNFADTQKIINFNATNEDPF